MRSWLSLSRCDDGVVEALLEAIRKLSTVFAAACCWSVMSLTSAAMASKKSRSASVQFGAVAVVERGDDVREQFLAGSGSVAGAGEDGLRPRRCRWSSATEPSKCCSWRRWVSSTSLPRSSAAAGVAADERGERPAEQVVALQLGVAER